MARASKAGKTAKKTAAKSAAKKSTAKKAAAKKATTPANSPSKNAAKTAAKKSPSKRASADKKTTSRKNVADKATAASKPAKKADTKKAAPKKADTAKKATRAKKAKSPFDSRFLEQMRKLLHVERDTYERQAIMLKAEADSLVADLDPGDVQFDEESGEGDTIAVERGRDLALAAKAREMIEEIDHALSKFDGGTYGICEVSGEPIPKERLEAIPWAREKVEYKVGGFGRR